MIEKGKISASQLGKTIYLAIIPTAILTIPSITYEQAKQDAWISPIWAFSGVIVIAIVLGYYRLFPNHNFITQASGRMFGGILGKLLALLFCLYYLYLSGIIVREYSQFVVSTFLKHTPMLVITGSIVIVSAFTVRAGLENVVRFAELILAPFVVIFSLIIIMIIPDLDIMNMMPVMGEGILPSFKGSLILQTWYSEFIIASFLLPYVSDRQNVKKSLFLTLLMVILTMIIANLATLLLLGEITGGYTYPFLVLSRYISLADFFTHVSALFMAIWVLGAFVKISVFYYVIVLGTAQWTGLSDYRHIVFPIGLLLIIFSIWVASNHQEMVHAIATSVMFLTLMMFVLIPSLLFGLAWLKKRSSH